VQLSEKEKHNVMMISQSCPSHNMHTVESDCKHIFIVNKPLTSSYLGLVFRELFNLRPLLEGRLTSVYVNHWAPMLPYVDEDMREYSRWCLGWRWACLGDGKLIDIIPGSVSDMRKMIADCLVG